MALTPDEIERVIRLGEDSENEFKSVRYGLPRAGDIAQLIVAFANTGGGRIWFGIEDDGTVTGVGDRTAADALLRLLDEVCQHDVVPSITCRHVKAEHLGELLIVTEVPPRPPRSSRTKSRSLERRSTTLTHCTSGSTTARSTAKSCPPTAGTSGSSSPTFAS